MVPKDHEQRMTLNSERITFWLGKGAKPTERVHKMLAAAGLAEPLVIRDQPKKSGPGKKRAEREAEAAEATAAAETPVAAAAGTAYDASTVAAAAASCASAATPLWRLSPRRPPLGSKHHTQERRALVA